MRTRALIAAALLLAATQARADLLIQIDKNTQRMTVSVDGQPRYVWPVSTGIARYDTPDGDFKPFRMEKDHFSKEWDDAPMPYSIFFTRQGHAIHGTNHASIGRPASHGCVRLSVANAAKLWDLVTAEGMNKTRVVLTGEIPGSDAVARRQPNQHYGNEADVTGALPPREARLRNGYSRYYSSDDDYAQPPAYVYRDRPYYYQRRVYRDDWQPAPAPFPFWGR